MPQKPNKEDEEYTVYNELDGEVIMKLSPYREYTEAEVIAAINDYVERLRIKMNSR